MKIILGRKKTVKKNWPKKNIGRKKNWLRKKLAGKKLPKYWPATLALLRRTQKN